MSSLLERSRESFPQAPHSPCSTLARMLLATTESFGATLTTLADSAFSSWSFHHSGLATSSHEFWISTSNASAKASAHSP